MTLDSVSRTADGVDCTGRGQASAQTATRSVSDLPGPKRIPLLGNLHQLEMTKLHLILERWAAEFGEAYVFRKGRRDVVVLSNREMVDQALRGRPETFRRDANMAKVIAEMAFESVYTAEGETWRPQRRLSLAALSQRNFRGVYSKVQTVSSRFLARLRRLADSGQSVDIIADLKRYTVDVTVLITFGYDINTVEQEGDVIQKKLELIFPAVTRRMFAPIPTWRYFPLPQDRRLDAALAELRTWADELIASARKTLEREPERAQRPSNFIEAMVCARDERGEAFSDDVIYANLVTMLLAGEDTTAVTVAWAVHHLCDHPNWTAALRREADETLKTSEVAESFEIAHSLEQAGAVGNETMRLNPVSPLNLMEANTSTVVGDIHMPAGTLVIILKRLAGIDASNFADPLAFKPERWLEPPKGAHNVAAHIPFGGGQRICPGASLGLVEMKTLLSLLYKNFDIERVGERDEVREEFGFVMAPVGLKVRLRRRAA